LYIFTTQVKNNKFIYIFHRDYDLGYVTNIKFPYMM
jgi:hypothetical protein